MFHNTYGTLLDRRCTSLGLHEKRVDRRVTAHGARDVGEMGRWASGKFGGGTQSGTRGGERAVVGVGRGVVVTVDVVESGVNDEKCAWG